MQLRNHAQDISDRRPDRVFELRSVGDEGVERVAGPHYLNVLAEFFA